MSYADALFVKNCLRIIRSGISDEQFEVRPKLEDGTPAHTIKTLYVIEDLKDCKYPNDEILIGASAIIRDEICQMMGGHITDVIDYQ